MSRGRVVSAIGGAHDIEGPGRVRLVSVKKKSSIRVRFNCAPGCCCARPATRRGCRRSVQGISRCGSGGKSQRECGGPGAQRGGRRAGPLIEFWGQRGRAARGAARQEQEGVRRARGPAYGVRGGARPGAQRGGRLLLEVSWTEVKKEEQHPGAAHRDTAVLGR